MYECSGAAGSAGWCHVKGGSIFVRFGKLVQSAIHLRDNLNPLLWNSQPIGNKSHGGTNAIDVTRVRYLQHRDTGALEETRGIRTASIGTDDKVRLNRQDIFCQWTYFTNAICTLAHIGEVLFSIWRHGENS